jgi:hypothetical protein
MDYTPKMPLRIKTIGLRTNRTFSFEISFKMENIAL